VSICRICKAYDRGSSEMVKYGPRHYAHGTCAIAKWGKDILTKLPAHQLGKLPFLALKQAGLLDAASARIAEWEKECAAREAAWRAKYGVSIVKEENGMLVVRESK
jgi:hypothetical protein